MSERPLHFHNHLSFSRSVTVGAEVTISGDCPQVPGLQNLVNIELYVETALVRLGLMGHCSVYFKILLY
jgi:hypothetical protein